MQKKRVEVPTELADLTIGQFKHLAFIGRIQNERTRAVKQVAFLTGLTEHEVEGMTRSSYKEVLSYIAGLDTDSINYPLQPIIEVDQEEYGFEPDLHRIPLGAYADLENYTQDALTHLDTICSILYRPIKAKQGKEYIIEPYTGSKPETMQSVPMDVALGALAFFLRLKAGLQSSTLRSLKAEAVQR